MTHPPTTPELTTALPSATPARVHLAGEANENALALHLLPANGFPPESYLPLLQPLAEHSGLRAVSFPIRPLLPVPPDPAELRDWSQFADDFLRALRANPGLFPGGLIAAGHSFGGVAAIIAASRAPEHFRGAILFDPTIFPQIAYPIIRFSNLIRRPFRLQLVEQARRRRAHFASHDEAFAYWRGKPLFRDWSDDGVWAYTRALLVEMDNGDGYTLRWPPAWEARIYETIYLNVWSAVRALRKTRLPLLFIRGETTNVFRASTARYIARILPNATIAGVKGHGHLFPMSAPDATRAIVETWLRAQKLV